MWLITPGVTLPRPADRYLLPHEHSLIVVRRHPAILMGPVFAVLAALAAVVALTSGLRFSGDVVLIIWLAWGLLLLRMIWRVVNWLHDYYVVTAERMLVVRGYPARDVTMVPMARLADMSYRRSAMGSLLGYGRFLLQLGGPDERMRVIDYLPYPEQLYLEVAGMVFSDLPVPDSNEPGEGHD
jgi:membrane protein YdbS with pleckstrin-like domain